MLRDLQLMLGEINGIEAAPDINDFLITDHAVLTALHGASSDDCVEEKLLVMESGECADVALYLDAELLERLDRENPREQLGPDNLADFCTVLEGISHFNYYAWNAGKDKRVTLHELEMQAEVDKYIGARVLLDRQVQDAFTRRIIFWLFENVSFHAHLNDEELERYRSANDYAARYCSELEDRFPRNRIGRSLVQELQKFFRLSQTDKISHIQALKFSS